MVTLRDDLLALVARARRGEKDSVNPLLVESTPMVTSMLRAYVGNEEDAKDIRQEVLLEVYRSIRKLEDSARYLSWLARICQRRAIDWLRRRYREAELRSYEVGFRIEDVPSSESRDALLDLLSKELIAEIEDAVARLPERYRRVLELRLKEGFGVEEIAASLGKRMGTVKSLLSRGMIRLRNDIERSA